MSMAIFNCYVSSPDGKVKNAPPKYPSGRLGTPGGLGALHKFFRTSTRQSAIETTGISCWSGDHGTPERKQRASLREECVETFLSLEIAEMLEKIWKKCASNESGSGFHGFPYVKKTPLESGSFMKEGFKNLEFLMLHIDVARNAKKTSGFMSDLKRLRHGFSWPRNGVWLRRGKQPASWFCLVCCWTSLFGMSFEVFGPG